MTRMPSLFVSHGAPTFATEPAQAGPLLRQLGARLPPPAAVLVLSPHWMTPTLRVGASAAPPTVHDFGGFPAELYAIEYPAPGAPALARRAVDLLRAAGLPAEADPHQGLDHGAWVPVRHLFPQADVPVLQISMPRALDPAGALALGRALAPLADDGVLLVGSGSITHNLYEFRGDLGAAAEPYACEFVDWVRGALARHDEDAVVDYLRRAPHARRAHPTPDHYLPLPFALGAAAPAAPVRVIDGGMTYGMLAMDAYLFGEVPHA